jgi:quercetin dioxygenase-like cupin family protein
MLGSSAAVTSFGRGQLLSVAGTIFDILVTGEQTDGRYGLAENLIPPDSGPPPHTHSREHEGFFVLEGELSFTVGGRTQILGAGQFLHAPRGIEHSFRNHSRQPARLLVLLAPAGFEQYFQETGEPLPPGSTQALPMTEAHLARLLECAPKYGLKFADAVLAAAPQPAAAR